MKRKHEGSYKASASRITKPLQISEVGQTEENLRVLLQGATEDLIEKRASGELTGKDLSSLLKLIEGHSRLEKLEIERDKVQGEVSIEAVEGVLRKLGVSPKVLEVLNEPSED